MTNPEIEPDTEFDPSSPTGERLHVWDFSDDDPGQDDLVEDRYIRGFMGDGA